MASLIAAGAVLELAYATRQQAQMGYNVIHYRARVTTGQPTDQDVVDAMDGLAAPLYKAYLPTAVTYWGTKGSVIFPLPRRAMVTQGSNRGAGTVNTDPLPKQVTLVITKQTNNAGRRYRGRTYLPFWGESQNDAGNRPTNAATAAAATIGVALLQAQVIIGVAGTVTIDPILWHRATQTYDIITQTRPGILWATQRRRGDFGRINDPDF